MNRILYLKKEFGYKKGLGYVLIIKALYSLIITNIFFGVIQLTIGLYFILSEGTELNLEEKTYRLVKSIFGIQFGKWKDCPNFEYISVFNTKDTGSSLKKNIIQINLFYNGNKHLTFFETQNKDNAFKVAEKIKEVFKIDILTLLKVKKSGFKSTTTNS